MTPGLLALAPLRIEANAVQRGAPRAEVLTTGMGPERARRSAFNLAARCAHARAVAVTGFSGALQRDIAPGTVIVADEVRGPFGAVPIVPPTLLVSALRRAGLNVRVGPIVSAEQMVRGRDRLALAESGAIAVDMESGWLVEAAPSRPRAVVRVVVDTPERELPSWWTLSDGLRAYRALSRAASVLDLWASTIMPRDVLLAGPRSFCAGVERAIDIVERALDRYGAPVYVRKQIVHNRHVVDDLAARGAIFVDELDEVPEGATVVFSAHGVSPAVRNAAEQRELHVIDATCPLVAKVHAETRRFARQGYSVLLVGHRGHEETEGTMGEADGIKLITGPADAETVEVDDPERVAYITQTTLAVDEVAGIVDRLQQRFPALVGPAADDICYATQNRQNAVRAIARDCDLLLVVGSRNSSNSNRLVEVARRQGCAAELIDDARDIHLEWLTNARTVGVTAGASAPESLVDEVVAALGALGPVSIHERAVTVETTQFSLPAEVR
ncbi:MAG TPA: 4-hydroxy-3-methylbut-2-enyl diphosphate reductase [Acidimicrobiales bacterium]